MKSLTTIFTLSLLTVITQTAFSQDVEIDSSTAGNNKAFTADTETIVIDKPVDVVNPNAEPEPLIPQSVVIDKGITIIGPDGKQYKFDAKNAKQAPIIVRDLVKPYLVPEAELERDDLYFIGVTLKQVPAEYQALVGAEPGYGMLITGVIDDAPADLAGIRVNDVLLEANGDPIKSVAEIQSVFRLAENNPVTLKIRRKLETMNIEIQPVLWDQLNNEAQVALNPHHRPHRIPESMEPYLRRQFVNDLRYLNGDLDDDLLINEEVASESDVEQLQKDINILRGEFEARQELMLKKLDELQNSQNNE